MRTYLGPGAKDLFDLLEKRRAEVEAAIRSGGGWSIDEALDESFPGSDPVSISQPKPSRDDKNPA